MKKLFLPALFFLMAVCAAGVSQGQTADSMPATKTYRVGVFAPLYLDSVFSASGNFRYTQGIPKFITPAVDFINGFQIALDSLVLDSSIKLETYIYDTKSYSAPLLSLIKNKKLDKLDLLVGPVRDLPYRMLADYAISKHTPFVSVAYPNDGGITSNPYTIILNSTLRAHCEAIYSYILQDHGTDKIFLCRKKGAQEDRVAGYFRSLNDREGKPLLNIQTINFDSTITASQLQSKLDSNRQSIIIGGSLDESFAAKLAYACRDISDQYPLTLIGMPNWDGIKIFSKKDEFKDFPIYYTTPYFNSKNDDYSRMLIDAYRRKLNGNPSDLAYKGFECARMFIKLITEHPTDYMSHLNDKNLKIFTDFNFKPVSVKGTSLVPDYIENKHLYFVRILNGSLYKAW